MRIPIIICMLLSPFLQLRAQEAPAFTKTNLYLELGGAGFLSANVEQLFPLHESLRASARLGLGFYPSELGIMGGKTVMSAIVPLTGSLIWGKRFSLETGLGLSLGFDKTEDAYDGQGVVKWFNGIAGFRYQRPDGGFLFRLGYTPWIGFPSVCLDTNCQQTERTTNVIHALGLSLGARLRKQ
jgi:hypothetical protein